MQWIVAAWRGTWRDRAVLLAVAMLFVGPAAILAIGDKPSRFGFQMYSGYGVVEASWQDADGEMHPVDLEDHLASERVDVDWTQQLPQQLCDRLEGAVLVEVSRVRPGEDDRSAAQC